MAKNCGLLNQNFKDMLYFEVSNKPCSLVPLCDCEEHRECFLRIFSYANQDYMKYYSTGSLKEPDCTNNWFYSSLKNINQKFPRSITFLIKVEDKVVARIGLGPLNNRGDIDAEIGYALEQSYSGKGIMGKAVGITLNFLTHLRNSESNHYNFTRLRATAKLDNKASNSLLASNKFVLNKHPVGDRYLYENEYFYYF